MKDHTQKIIDMLRSGSSIDLIFYTCYIDFKEFREKYFDKVRDYLLIYRVEVNLRDRGTDRSFTHIPCDDWDDLGVYSICTDGGPDKPNGPMSYIINDGKHINWITYSEIYDNWKNIEKLYLSYRRAENIKYILER